MPSDKLQRSRTDSCDGRDLASASRDTGVDGSFIAGEAQDNNCQQKLHNVHLGRQANVEEERLERHCEGCAM